MHIPKNTGHLWLAFLLPWGFAQAQDSTPICADPVEQLDSTPPDSANTDGGQAEANPLRDSRDAIYYPGDTERIKPLGRKLFLNLLVDQKEIWTSPFHMNRHNAPWWALFAGGTAALIATDHHTINTFRNSSGQITWGNNVS